MSECARYALYIAGAEQSTTGGCSEVKPEGVFLGNGRVIVPGTCAMQARKTPDGMAESRRTSETLGTVGKAEAEVQHKPQEKKQVKFTC